MAEPGAFLLCGLVRGVGGVGAGGVADVAEAAGAVAVGGVAEVLDEGGHAAGGGLGEGDHAVDLGAADGDLGLVALLPWRGAGVDGLGEADVAGDVHVGYAGDEEFFDGAVEGFAVDHVLLLAKKIVDDVDGGEVGGEDFGDALEVVDGGVVFFEEELLEAAVGEAVEEDGAGGEAVATGAAYLLVVAFDGAGQGDVDDGADVGFVDAHAEGDGGDDDVERAERKARWTRSRVWASRPAW